MWTTLGIIIGAILCCLFVIPLYGFVTEFLKQRREGRQPRLRIFDEE